MKRIILTTSLFFCLTITTILAAVATVKIATPVAGLSTNSVTDFDVNSDGTILNNSATGGTALGTTVTGNGNITAGSEASLILLQVTGTSGSDLDGTIEVFGGEAGLIIANPNGITCNGCAFTNVSRVDLVTGSGYDADTNTFSTIAATDIDISSSGLTTSVLKIQTGADFTNAGAIVADTVTIDVKNFANDIANTGTGTVSADSLNLILTNDFTHGDDSFNGFNFSNLAIKTEGRFNNNNPITVNSFTVETDYFTNYSTIIADNFTATVVNSFTNNTAGVINAANFTVTANEFANRFSSTINAASFTVIVNGDFINQYDTTITADSFAVTANYFNNNSTSTITADTVTIEVPDFVNGIDNFGTVSSASLNFIFTDSFDSSSNLFPGFNNFSDLAITTNGTFTNNHTIGPDSNLTITADTFTNNATINPTGNLTITANTFLNAASATITAGECNIVATTFTDNGTINCLDSLADAMVIDIETPDANGLSNNPVLSFDVIANGTILNNSAVGGTTQFRSTDVEGNSNITVGSEADLILFQITGSTVSDLGGTIEIFGGEAGLIIANPNGISCNSCFFINANRVDLVTGSNYDFNTNTFGDIAATDITLGGSSLELDVLNIQTGANFNNDASINTNNLNITAGADFNNDASINTDNLNITAGADFSNSATINNTDTVTIKVTNFANDIGNSGTISSANLNFILTDSFTHNSTSFTGFNNNFNNFSNLAITTEGTFTNTANIYTTGNTTITANTFINTGGVVDADTFSLSVAGAFDYANNGTITANAYNFNIGGNFSYDDPSNDFVWGANDILTVSGTASVVAAGFTNSGTINVTNSLNVTSNTFSNAGGELDADTLALSVAGDFDYIADYLNNGTITTNALNLDVGGNFSNNDTNNDFTWRSTDTLTVSGNANIDVAGFANSGTITVTNNSLNITANTFANSGGEIDAATFNLDVADNFDYDEGTITTNAFNLNVDGNFSYDNANNDFTWRATDTLTVLGNANIVAADFNNSGTINVTNIFDITAAANFTNAGNISASSFNVMVDDFINQSSAEITAGECNIVATTSSDTGTITCIDEGDVIVFNIATSSGGLSRNNYTDFHIPLNGVVFNNSLSDATSQLAGPISANPNVSGGAASIILAQVSGPNSFLFGALEVVGAEAAVLIANPNGITCNGCSFINASRVDLVTGSSYNLGADSFINIVANSNIAIIENGFLDASSVGILNIHAGGFTNTGVLEANTLNLNVVGDFDNTQRGIINATIFNLEVGGDFSYEDESIGFVWEERDTLTVGSANITTNNFINHGNINVTNFGSFEITAGYTVINQGSIVSENGSLDITTDDFFRNLTGGYIAVNSLNIIAGGKVTNTATIDVATLSITASDDSSRTNDRTGFYVSNRGNITATTLNITAVDNFYNRGNITATNFNITRAKDIFFLNKEIDSYDGTYDGGNISLNGDSSFRADGDIIENYGNIISLNGNSSFIADGGSIQNYGHISLTGDSSFIADGIIENYGHIISLNGDSSFRADGGSIQNYGHIDFGSNNLDISADSFTNHADATIDAATLNLTVSSYIDDGTIDAVVSNNGSIIDTTSDTTNNQ